MSSSDDDFIDAEEESDAEESAASDGDDSEEDNDFESPKAGSKKKTPAKAKPAAKPKAPAKAAAKTTPKKAAAGQKKASAKASGAPKTPAAAKKAASTKVTSSGSSLDDSAAAKAPSAAKKRPAAAAAAGSSALKKAAVGAGSSSSSSSAVDAGALKKTPETAVRDYMRQTNRPYSVINIVDNLGKKIPRAMVQKILDQLVASGELQVKEYGKNVVYFCNQSKLEEDIGEVTQENLDALEQQEKQLTKQLQGITTELREVKAENAKLTAEPADDALEDELTELIDANEAEDARLSVLRDAQGGPGADPKALEKAKAQFNKMRSLWIERRSAALEAIDNVSDGMDKKPKVVMDLMGLEHEPKNFQMPPKMS